MFERDALDDALFLQPVEAIRDLVLVGHEQRPAALQRDADLRGRKATRPAKDKLPDRAGHAAPFEHEVGDGREATFRHDGVRFTWRISKA